LAAPRISFRFYAPELPLLKLAAHYLAVYVRALDLKEFDSDLHLRLCQLRQTLCRWVLDETSNTHRAHFDATELAILMFLVRRAVREGRSDHWFRHQEAIRLNVSRFHRRLEVLRRRAKRAWVNAGGMDDYKALQHRCKRFFRGVNLSYGGGRLKIPCFERGRKPFKVQCQEILERALTNVRLVLEADREPVPDERDLRLVVRRMLRHMRRGRGTATVRDVLIPNEAGKWAISMFVVPRLRDLQRAREFPDLFPKRLRKLVPQPKAQATDGICISHELFENFPAGPSFAMDAFSARHVQTSLEQPLSLTSPLPPRG
jgi:hypothetical protein